MQRFYGAYVPPLKEKARLNITYLIMKGKPISAFYQDKAGKMIVKISWKDIPKKIKDSTGIMLIFK